MNLLVNEEIKNKKINMAEFQYTGCKEKNGPPSDILLR